MIGVFADEREVGELFVVEHVGHVFCETARRHFEQLRHVRLARHVHCFGDDGHLENEEIA